MNDCGETVSETLIYSSAARLASHRVPRVSALVRAIHDGDGQSFSALLATCGHGGWSQSSHQESSLFPTDDLGGPSSRRWPRWAIATGTALTALMPWAHRTEEIASSSSPPWPTPRSCSAMAATITPEAIAKAADRFPNLETVVAREQWPTPRAYRFKDSHLPGLTPLDIRVRGLYPEKGRYWPTPQSSELTNSLDLQCSGDGRAQPNKLGWAVAAQTETWPTPTAIDAGSGRMNKSQSAGAAERPRLGLMAGKNLWPSPRASDGEKGGPNQRGSKGDLMLPSAVQALARPTPTTNDARNATAPPSQQNRHSPGLATQVSEQWRTPNAYDAQQRHNEVGTMRRLENGKTISLGMQMSVETGKCSSSLSYRWVSMLMGLPANYLDGIPPIPSPAGQQGQDKPKRSSSRRARPQESENGSAS